MIERIVIVAVGIAALLLTDQLIHKWRYRRRLADLKFRALLHSFDARQGYRDE